MKTTVCFLLTISFCADVFSTHSKDFAMWFGHQKEFALWLLNLTQSETASDENVVVSPLGIWSLMAGVALRATKTSYSQLSEAFEFPESHTALVYLSRSQMNPTTTAVSIKSKNFMFVNNDLTLYREFQTTIQNATFEQTRYESQNRADIANANFVDSGITLTNVISFKGLWMFPFDKSETQKQPFYNENEQVVGEVNMMYRKAPVPFSNVPDLKAHVIELPYGNDDIYSMLILLPHHNVKLADVYENLKSVTLKDIFLKLLNDIVEFGYTEVIIQIPRFKISTDVVLNEPLSDIGVHNIFQPDLASFEKVSAENTIISAIIQKANIEVIESGTVATPASTILINNMTPLTFLANKPFVYLVVKKPTMTVLFNGVYSKPTLY